MKQKRLIYLVVKYDYAAYNQDIPADICTTVSAFGNRKRAEIERERLNSRVKDTNDIQYWLEPWELN